MSGFTSLNMSMNYFANVMIDYMLFRAHCDYCLAKCELLYTVYEDVNCEMCTLLEQWDVCDKTIDEPCDFLDWLAWDIYKFDTSCSDSYIPPACISNYALLCEIFHCSYYDSTSCPYYISDDGFSRRKSMIEIMNELQVC